MTGMIETGLKKRGPLGPWAVATVVIVGAMAYLRLKLYPTEIVPLAYGVPMLLALAHRDLRLLWVMAIGFLATMCTKWIMLLDGGEVERGKLLVFGLMQLTNILLPATVLHGVIVLGDKLSATVQHLEKTNAELEASNEELAAREEEINQQNEELQCQAEELEQQTEELSAQTEELLGLNEQLAARERTLGELLETTTSAHAERDALMKFGQSVQRLLPRSRGAAVLEPDGAAVRVSPLFGLGGDGSAQATLKRERTMAGLVVSRDKAGFLADTSLRPDLDVPALEGGARARSVLAAPLRARDVDGSPVHAALEIYSDQAGEWTEAEVRLAQWAAEQCGRLWINSRLQRELDSQRELLATVTDNSSAALFMLDADGKCTYANPAALAMVEYTAAELSQRPLDQLLAAQSPATGWASGEHMLRRRNGQQFPAVCSATPVDRDGRPSGVVLEVRDVTQERAAVEEREQLLDSERAARAEAERAGRAKDEFVSTLSHELRTPLNAVLGWATILRRSAGGAKEVSQGLEVIERNARHQAQLISDLLDMSKITAGMIRLDVQAVDLPLVVEAALDAVRPAAEAKGVRLDRVIEPMDRMVTGDPNRLQQVVWNLLTNAVKFTPKGGSVQVAVSRVASYVQISVTDSGQGIPEDLLPQLFQRYRQGDSSATRHQGGLGIGLAIVKHLVELHGGTVHARSAGESRGSTFTVLLPVRAVDPPAHVENEPHPSTPAAHLFENDAPSLAGLSILVVDDEADARELVSRVLSERGASVRGVASAEEALGALNGGVFNLMVSDIGMPGIDGYTLIRRIRGERGLSSATLPAVALTAFARSEDRTKALLAGFQSHISKPVEAAELIATVASVRPMMSHSGDHS